MKRSTGVVIVTTLIASILIAAPANAEKNKKI